MGRFYEGANSLFVRAYDAFYAAEPPQIAGDVAFYEQLARETGGPVLELGCGTGRIALALAQRGLDITGIDVSDGMLTLARRKAAACPALVRDHLALINQDMRHLRSAFWPRLRSLPFLSTPFDDRSAATIASGHSPPSGADRPVGPSLVRSSSRFADRRKDYTAGAFRHRP